MIKLGIISLNHPHSVGNHLPALKYMTDRIRVEAIYNDDRDYAEEWLRLFKCKYYPSRDALLADPDIDVVLITSINQNHAADAIAAAKAGKDILCDKPIALSVEETIQLRAAIEQSGVRFFTTFPVRFNSAVQELKKQVEAGEFGQIKAIMATNHGCMYEPGAPDWVFDPKKNGGGCIVDHTVHVADIIRWLTNSEFSTVNAKMRKAALHDNIVSEDIAVMHGNMQNGCIWQIDASWNRRPEDPMWGDVTLRVIGTLKSAYLDIYNNQPVEIYTQGRISNYYLNSIVFEHGLIFDDYIQAVKNGKSIGADLEDGIKTIELVINAYKSVAQGKTISCI